MRTAWLEIDLDALEYNWRLIQTKAQGEVIPVLKADAYGHGALFLARYLLARGARRVAVARVSEGRALRQGGVEGEVLLLGSLHPLEAEEALRWGLVPSLSTWEAALALSQRARALGLSPRAHLEVDTGMHRTGVDWREAAAFYHRLRELGVRVEGVYTHLASAEEDPAFTELQRRRFAEVRRALGEGPLYHLENSAGLFLYGPSAQGVRVGLALYGLFPGVGLRPILRLKARPTLVKRLEREARVGYGGEYVAKGGEWLATLPVGYADGLPRGQARWVRGPDGALLPIVGRISMDQIAVRLEGPVGLEAVFEVIGKEGKTSLFALAEARGTIVYEAATSLKRLPRLYLAQGRVYAEEDAGGAPLPGLPLAPEGDGL
ncbi:alanine racemase [Thermus filiformis]|uniref:alanine racemase n=1 Tax=Thermus filiformis TaxID=276 RepID=UPI00053208C8|nr:alanine racemase [Thermus filiformis]